MSPLVVPAGPGSVFSEVCVKRNIGSHAGERGASFLLVMALGMALLGIVGLALDGGNLYVTKQRAQAAADAAAQAGVMDLYRGNGTAAASASAKAYGVKVEELPAFYAKRTLLNEIIVPDDIANACFAFVGGLLNKSTGNVLNVDGGVAMGFVR